MAFYNDLKPQHLEELHTSAIPDDLIEQAGIRLMTDDEAEGFGFRSPGSKRGMFFPYLDITTGRFSDRFGRLKPDVLAEGRKYLQPVGERNRLYFTPGTTLAELEDSDLEVFLVEGEKKALTVLAWARRTGRRSVVIGIGGCQNWRRSIKGEMPDGSLGKVGSEAIADFDLINWVSRRTTLCLDGDVVSNPAVASAESDLIHELLARRASVFAIRIPPDQQGHRRGADDLIAQEGDAAWATVSDRAIPKHDPNASVSDLLRDAGLEDLGEKAALDQVEPALAKLRVNLRGVDPLRRSIAREGVVQALKRAGLTSPAAIADAALPTQKAEAPDDRQGRPLLLTDPEPWAESVDGAQLLNDILDVLGRYLMLPQGGAVAIALWILHSHTFDASSTSPFMVLKSPTKRAGKTRGMTILAGLVPRALPTSNISPAAVFRTIEAYRPTLLVDEADSFLESSPKLVETLHGS
jgi:hypothetical protein